MPLHGLSDKFLAAVATDHTWDVEVLVKKPDGTQLADITEDVLDGSVSVDETREFRRTLSLRISPTQSLIPFHATDLLHPATSNELWVSRGVKYSDGSSELAPLGVFRLSRPNASDTGAAVGFSISGNDRSAVVARQGWKVPFQLRGGSNPGGGILTALQSLIGAIYPGMDFSNFQAPTFGFPTTTWGVGGQRSDPMADLQTFAAAAGCELFFDPLGNPVFRVIVNPATASVVDSVHFVEGANCVMDQATKTLDETTAFNGVKLTCNGPGSAGPFMTTVWDTDPSSPTYYLGTWGQVPYPMTTTLIPAGSDTLVQAQGKAVYMASQQLQLILGAMDSTNLTCVPNSALREGDALAVKRDRIRIDSTYVISNMTIPLNPKSRQAIAFRPQVSAA